VEVSNFEIRYLVEDAGVFGEVSRGLSLLTDSTRWSSSAATFSTVIHSSLYYTGIPAGLDFGSTTGRIGDGDVNEPGQLSGGGSAGESTPPE
jgi:hypothetical protein